MYIKHVSLRNFKNYEDFSFGFEPSGCLIIGNNGIGKTNLLDAISYFTYGRSVLHVPDQQLINYHAEKFNIKSVFSIDNDDTEFNVSFSKEKKLIRIENNPLKKLSDLYRLLQVVYSGPDDIFRIFSTPAKRRQFMDMAISKIFPVYMDFFRRFKNAHVQRNALLKTNFSPSEKESWDITFCMEAKNIVEYRIKFFDLFKGFFITAYKMIVQENEEVDIALKLNFNTDGDFVNEMMKVLHLNLQKEKRHQETVVGPHRDDIDILINQKIALFHASQGQKRSIVIAMKIALANIITNITGKNPIMIFDDTLAELDLSRSNNLLTNMIEKHQIFIASPTSEKYLNLKLPVLELHQQI